MWLSQGATSGLGEECAKELCKEGCFIALTGRNASALEEVSKACQSAGVPQDKVRNKEMLSFALWEKS